MFSRASENGKLAQNDAGTLERGTSRTKNGLPFPDNLVLCLAYLVPISGPDGLKT